MPFPLVHATAAAILDEDDDEVQVVEVRPADGGFDDPGRCFFGNCQAPTKDEEFFCKVCCVQCDADMRDPSLSDDRREELKAGMRTHASRMAKKACDTLCAGCLLRGPMVNAYTRGGLLCRAVRKTKNDLRKFGNNCKSFYHGLVKEWKQITERDPTAELKAEFVPELAAKKAARDAAEPLVAANEEHNAKNRLSSRKKRMKNPDAEPSPERKKKHQKNRCLKRIVNRAEVKAAKASGDLPTILAVTKKQHAFQNHQEILAHCKVNEDEPAHQPFSFSAICAYFQFALFFPMLMVAMFTDGTMHIADGMFCLHMTGQSASVVAACLYEAWLLRNKLRLFDTKQYVEDWDKKPTLFFRLVFEAGSIVDMPPVPPGEPEKCKTVPVKSKVSIDNARAIEKFMAQSMEVDRFRLTVREYLKTEGVHSSREVPCRLADLPVIMTQAVLEGIIDQCVNDKDIKMLLIQAARGKHGEAAKASIYFGLVYTKATGNISAWWFYWIVALGFGSSHLYVDLVVEKWNEVLKYVSGSVESKRAFDSKILLAWACFDGSILPGNFNVLLPWRRGQATFDAIKNAGPDTVVGIFMAMFRDLGIEPNIYWKTCGSKDLVTLYVCKKADRKKIGDRLLPYAVGNGYVSRKRMKNLQDYVNGVGPELTAAQAVTLCEAEEDAMFVGEYDEDVLED